MPLSEQEQRLLDEMERNLYRHDADFVATVSGSSTKPDFRAMVIGILIAILGIAVVVTGVATRLPIVGVLGFLIMFGGVLISLRRSKERPGVDSKSGTREHRRSFMDRMNEKWDSQQNRPGG